MDSSYSQSFCDLVQKYLFCFFIVVASPDRLSRWRTLKSLVRTMCTTMRVERHWLATIQRAAHRHLEHGIHQHLQGSTHDCPDAIMSTMMTAETTCDVISRQSLHHRLFHGRSLICSGVAIGVTQVSKELKIFDDIV